VNFGSNSFSTGYFGYNITFVVHVFMYNYVQFGFNIF